MSKEISPPSVQGKGGTKRTYYCVMAVFYNDGSLPHFELTERKRFEEHPGKSVMQGSKSRTVKTWYSTRAVATRAMEREAAKFPGAETWCGL